MVLIKYVDNVEEANEWLKEYSNEIEWLNTSVNNYGIYITYKKV